MSRTPFVRRFVALILAELLLGQPLQTLRQPLTNVAFAAPRTATMLAATPQAFPEADDAAPDAETAQPQAASESVYAAAGTALDVFVGFADSATPSANFPTPWQGAPNVLYLGGGSPVNAGAIRLDNPSGAPVVVERVSVDLQRANAQFSLWENFTIPARGSAILTQTLPGNFDTSAYPIVACGAELPAGDPRVPEITVTVAGVAQSFRDTAHVLDTGGFDSSCRGNESLQWRAVGTRGIDHPAGELSLGPSLVTGSGGSPATVRATLRDANGTPLPNVTINFRAVSGPNAGAAGQGVTDSRGDARFTYTGTAQGADVVRATVANGSGETVSSNDVTVQWQTASCGPDVPTPVTGEAQLLYIGATRAQYSDPIELAGLLLDATGAPAAGRTLAFTFGTVSFTGVTDATGVARVATTANVSPAEVPVAVDFAGGAGLPALRATQVLTVTREDVLLRYTAKTLLGTAVPQTVSATLHDPDSLAPLAGKSVTFTAGSVTATAVTDASGKASTTITLGADQVSGPGSLAVSFSGDAYHEPAFRTVAVTIYLSTSFVVWGGNTGGLKLGDHVNFWGAQWESQVRQGDYKANASFKGFADPINQIHVCQPQATSKTLTPTCWTSKGGQSWPPPVSVPAYIEVIVSTVVDKQGNDIYGNIAAAAVVRVDPQPRYEPVPGKPGWGVIVAVIEDSGVFPAPAVVTATQSQPQTVLPNEQFTITTRVTNASPSTAATNVVLTETLDGLTPDSASRTIGTINAAQTESVSFDATTPPVPIRQGSETAAEYIRRLTALDGRVYTAAGQVTFSDANQQLYLPVDVSSRSILTIPVLTLALSGPSVVSPGAPAPYKVTVTNIGSAPATGTVSLTMPDGTLRTVDVAGLVPGSSFMQIESFTPVAIAPKGASETAEEYLARLRGADGQLLTAKAELTWSDAKGNAYGDVGQQLFTSRIRVPVLTFTTEGPAQLLPTQTATLRMHVRNDGGCTAVLSNLSVTNPDGTLVPAPQFVLAAGEATTIQTTWRVPEVPKRDDDGETDAQYLARLLAANNRDLDFAIALDWSDPSGAVYGPTAGASRTKQIIPIVPITLTAPETAVAGTSITYAIGASNIGSASAPQTDLTITLPDGTMHKPAVPALAAGDSWQGTFEYAIPTTQAAGPIEADAFAMWNDIAATGYGPFEAFVTTEVTNPTAYNKLVLTPVSAGPNVKGTAQTMTATLTTPAGAPIAGATVQFTVTGGNPTTGTATTDAAGMATFTYTGANAGTDNVQCTSGNAVSNSATVNWIAPVQKISTTPSLARFFTSNDSGSFNTLKTATPVFMQAVPTINFNPPNGTVPGIPPNSGIGVNSRPFINVTTDPNGTFSGTIVAEGNGFRAGVGALNSFQAVFTGSFTVASAGDIAISFYSDDGFILGVGGGATRVSGQMFNPPPSGVTEFEGLPVMGCYNSGTSPVANTVVVRFPAAGTYPYEVDYSECCGGQLALTMAAGNVSNRGMAPTSSLKLMPISIAAKPVGEQQTLTVEARDGSGLTVANAGLSLVVNGSNFREIPGTTDANGIATFSYTANYPGTDQAQAIGRVGGLATFSNVVNVPWSGTSSPPNDPNFPPGNAGAVVTQGWLGVPMAGSSIQARTNITVVVSVVAGVLDYWPSDNPAEVRVLNPSFSGNGLAGTIDPTILANGEYTIRFVGRQSNGTQQTSLITVNVTGENKPGRVTKFVTDLTVPLAGMPISVSRKYDSLERGKSSDFGYGWSLVTSVRLEVNKKNDVTFTLDGRRQTFTFAPQPSGFPFTFFLMPKWVPEPGTRGTLTATSCGLLVMSQGTYTCFLEAPGSFQPSSYTYTDPYGREYVIGADGQMQRVKDLAGNTLTFTRDGISSSAGGVTVPFTRDASGRITRITDLSGAHYDYSYDSAGDLVSVQLPGVDSAVGYGYQAGHYLIKETDPRGASTSVTYHPDGRIKSETDRMGNTVQFAYAFNATTSTTTYTYADGGTVVRTNNAFGDPISIKDQLNRTTTFTHDGNHNLLTRTNALGKTWTFTYDANGNMTSAKDPLGNISKKNWDARGRLLTVTDALQQVKSFQYDAASNVTGLSDSLGQIMSATYNSKGSQTSQTIPGGRTAQFSYDGFGNMTGLVDHSGFSSTLQYDSTGQITAIRDARHGEMKLESDPYGHTTLRRDGQGNTLRYSYDANGNRVTETDPNGNPFTHVYDAEDRLIRTIFPGGAKVELAYDYAGRVTTRTDEAGIVHKYVYDKAGQITSITTGFGTPSAITMGYTYDSAGRVNSAIDGRNNTTLLTYDDADRMKMIRDAAGHETSFTYDANNQVTAALRADNVKHETRYDVRGRPTTTINPDGSTTLTTFGALQLTSATDEAGRTTSYTYDNHGEIATVTDPAGHVTGYTRDSVGNLTALRDPNGRETKYEYDTADRLVKKTLPDGKYEQYTYDPTGHVTEVRLTDGHVNRFAWDGLDRLLRVDYFDGTSDSYTYTPTGQRATATTATGTTRYDYDALDRLSRVTQPSGVQISYGYDAADNITSITTPRGVTRYTYDVLDRVEKVTAPTGGDTTYTYDVGGRLSQRRLPNGVITDYTYDTRDRLTGVVHHLGAAAAFESFVHTLSPDGRTMSVREVSGARTNWSYDEAHRLIRETVVDPAGTTVAELAYAYDQNGNRTSMTANGVTTLYQYNELDQLTSAGNAQYTYDDRGNLVRVTDGASTTAYSYDAANRLSKAVLPDGSTETYGYNEDGRLIREAAGGSTRHYAWNELSTFGDVVYESDGGGASVANYSYGARDELVQRLGTDPSYYIHDALGNVAGLTNAAGIQTDRYRYDAWGVPTSATGSTPNPFRYRGQWYDPSTSLAYLRARHYSPGTGRFLSRDVAPFDVDDPVDLNRYTYAGGSPVDFYDPTGFMAAEYGGIARVSAENATILGYRAGRFAETNLSCALVIFSATFVHNLIGEFSSRGIPGPNDRLIWSGLRNRITIAFGWMLRMAIDVRGPDSMINPATETGRKTLLRKAQLYRGAPRELNWAMSGRYVNKVFGHYGGITGAVASFILSVDGVFLGNDQNLADKCGNHAERKIIRHARPPLNTLLSVGASRPVCQSCLPELIQNVGIYGGCFGPLGGKNTCRP
jgi:RHS repeat-associated protein